MSFHEMKARSYVRHFGTPRRQTEVVAGHPLSPRTGKANNWAQTYQVRSIALMIKCKHNPTAKVFSGQKSGLEI